MRLLSWSLLAVVVVALAPFGCGGQVAEPGADGGAPSGSSSGGSGSGSGAAGSGSGSGGGSSGVNVPPCPSEPPTPGMACVAGQQGCAYFTNQGCSAFLCDDSGVWQSATHGC